MLLIEYINKNRIILAKNTSVVRARNTGREHIKDEGLSKITLEAGESKTLKEVIDSDPAGFLGEEHFNKFGNNLGVLAKVVDSLNRLTIQVHPDKKFAKTVFHSDYGKTESWYYLGKYLYWVC